MNEKRSSPFLTWTGERYLPWLQEAAIGYEHIHRYAHATALVRNKRVLDLACGEGYGSYVLSKAAHSVLGIDSDTNAIKHARNTYIGPTLEFCVGSMTDIPIAERDRFDVVVCFEALEHIQDHHRLLGEVKRLLTPEGLFIVSTPNKTLYTDEAHFTNAFHVHELYFDEFRELLTAYFRNVGCLGQRIYCNSKIWPLAAAHDATPREYVIAKHTDEFSLVDSDKKRPLYFIAIASDGDIDASGSALVDVSNALLDQKDSQIAAHVTEQERLGGEITQLSAEVHRQRTVFEGDLQKERTQIDALIKERAAYTALAAQAQAAADASRRELNGKEHRVKGLEAVIRQRNAALSHIQVAAEASRQELTDQHHRIEILEADMRQRDAALSDIHAAAEASRRELTDKDHRIETLEAVIRQREAALSLIHGSHGWKALTMYYQLRARLLPAGRKRTEIAKSFWKLLGRTVLFHFGPPVAEGVVETPAGDQGAVVQSATTPRTESILIKPLIEEEAIVKEEVTVSVVIPTKTAGESFRRLLAALRSQRGFREIEIIVVDSGSTDKTVELAQEFGATLINIRPEEFSHSYARNLGASHASGEYLLFTVQDALPPSDAWLYELFSVIKSNAVAAVSCAEFPWESADLFYRAISWNHYRFLEVDRDDRVMRYGGSNDHLTLRKNGQLSDLACLISKEVFTRYQYQTDYGEDLDLGLRLIKDGHDIAFLGSARIIHSHNRPAYYYLKRGYVENMFLPQLFADYSRTEHTIERIVPGVRLTHSVIQSLVAESPWGLQFPCKTNEFSRRLLERFDAASDVRPLLFGEVTDGGHSDSAFNDFLGRLVKDHPVSHSGAQTSDDDLIDAVRTFSKMILTYMEDSYELVDDHIAGEFRSCLAKMFAYQCGARLALCKLWNCEREEPQLELIHEELSKGV